MEVKRIAYYYNSAYGGSVREHKGFEHATVHHRSGITKHSAVSKWTMYVRRRKYTVCVVTSFHH